MRNNIYFFCLILGCVSLQAQRPTVGGYNVYYGHLHNHSEISDGKGTPEEAYSYAQDTAKLDFFGLADHAEQIWFSEYSDMKEAANQYNQDGVFTTFYGFEWSSSVWGHVAVMNADDVYRSYWILRTFDELLDWLAENECVAFFNHPGREDDYGSEFNHFTDTSSDKFVGIELWNKNKGFDTYYYNDGYYDDDDGKGYYDEALIRGWRIGAAGSDDNHNATWGTENDYRLAILAKNLTRDDLYASLKARLFFSTLDKNLAMSFKMNEAEMGSEISAGTSRLIVQLSDSDSEFFSKVELLKNGAVERTWNPNKAEVLITDTLTTASGDYYYVKCTQKDGDEAISSPIWIEGTNANSTDEETISFKLEDGLTGNSTIREKSQLAFEVYPNPSSGSYVNVKIISDILSDCYIEVLDLSGSTLMRERVQASTHKIPLTNIESGFYFVRISNGKTYKTQQLIVR